MFNKKSNTIVFILISLCLSVLYFFFAYRHFYSIICGVPGPLDHINHANSGIHLFGELKNGKAGLDSFLNTDPYPLIILYPIWHIMVFLPYHFLNAVLNANVALAISISFVDWFFLFATWIIIIKILKEKPIQIHTIVLYALSAALLLVGPLDGSSIYGSYYLSAYTGNPWHSPTYIAVRPLALLTLDCFIKLLSNQAHYKRDYIKAAVLLLFSALFKPSFYQVFLPAFCVYCIIHFLHKPSLELFMVHLRNAVVCIPVCVIAIFQVFALPSSDKESGIGIGFLYVWKAFSSNWIVSLLCSIAFPLICCLLILLEKKWNIALSVVLLTFLSASLQFMLFYIKAFPYNADFSWGFDLAICFMFVYCVREGLLLIQSSISSRLTKGVAICCSILFVAHLYYGIRYFYSVFVLNQFTGPLPHIFT